MSLQPISLHDAQSARVRIADVAVRTPLLRLWHATHAEVHLKLECLQPIGSFKLRGAANAMALSRYKATEHGVYTASAGNMAQGVAWCARVLGVRCDVIVPDHAPRAKTDAIERLGGTVVRVPFDEWWQTLVDHGRAGFDGLFVHPFADKNVMAGNGTIALELLEDLADIDVVLVPWGGGGLASGIASVLREVSPRTKVIAVESETASPLTASRAAGKPVVVPYKRTFIDGMGSTTVSDEMWPLAQELVADTVVLSVEEVAEAVRMLVKHARVVAEGAGAATVAAAMRPEFAGKRVVAVISGGNLDALVLSTLLRGEMPA